MVVGWDRQKPVANYNFNEYLSSRDGRLFFEDLDLTQLLASDRVDQGLGRKMSSPLEIVYLPKIRQKIHALRETFANAIEALRYTGRFYYAYASKANAAEEVVRTALGEGAHFEISSTVDVEIARFMKSKGYLPDDRWIICNGFKSNGSQYAENIIRLKNEHDALIPVIEDRDELIPLIESGLTFEVGLRQKSYGPHQDSEEMDTYNSRFGMNLEDLLEAAEAIESASNLELRLYHAMVGSQLVNEDEFVQRLSPPMEVYARLRKEHESLSIFDYGGGIPVGMTLNFQFDYGKFARRLLSTMTEFCEGAGVPVPDIMGEMGRYTVAEHGAHLFKIQAVKDNGSQLPWYIIDGSIMSSFPDAWALGEHFIVLPLNHLDKPFQRVRLGGITCDSDDIYPPGASQAPLYLPVETEDLYIGFFGIGAYQEMLGGAGGSKHCVIPEADELIIDLERDGVYQFQILQGQGAEQVLGNLGYRR
jgi:arginine decarboxylase